jgi:hypothetical protein
MTIRSSNVSRTALLCLLLGSWVSACQRDKGPAAQGPSPTSATQHLATKLPSDWPSQVPTYPGGTIVSGMKMKLGQTVVQRTADEPAKVMAFYKAQLGGMRLVKSVENGAMQSATWSDDAQPPLRVTLNLGSGEQGKATFATLLVNHLGGSGGPDVAAAAGNAGAAAQ